jgi:hypothetical protein
LLSVFAAASAPPALAADAAKVPLHPSYVYPPWQTGQNTDVIDRGVEFTVPEVNNLPDFHGNPVDAKLVLYVGGIISSRSRRWRRHSKHKIPISKAASSGRRCRRVCWRGRWTRAERLRSAT